MVRGLRSGEEQAAADALRDAFGRDAFARWISPIEAERHVLMGAMFNGLLADLPPGAEVDVTDDIDAVAIWQPPGSDVRIVPPPDARPEVVDVFGQLNAAKPVQPFWYLRFIGARNPGAGAGSALL